MLISILNHILTYGTFHPFIVICVPRCFPFPGSSARVRTRYAYACPCLHTIVSPLYRRIGALNSSARCCGFIFARSQHHPRRRTAESHMHKGKADHRTHDEQEKKKKKKENTSGGKKERKMKETQCRNIYLTQLNHSPIHVSKTIPSSPMHLSIPDRTHQK